MEGPERKSFSNRQKSPGRRFLSVLGLFMFAFYFILGILIIFWKDIPLDIGQTYRILFGVLIVAYAFFRFVRLWQNR